MDCEVEDLVISKKLKVEGYTRKAKIATPLYFLPSYFLQRKNQCNS